MDIKIRIGNNEYVIEKKNKDYKYQFTNNNQLRKENEK